ncbi:MAG: DMT family transporter [Lachnospiraceae bacterium]|nr:DMT family transporter [Lachnospiraceae bacterium]
MKSKYQGIFFIICAAFFFSLMTFFVRLSGNVPTFQKSFFRNIVAAIVSVAILLRSEEKFKVLPDSWGPLFMRAGFGTAALVANFYAVDHMNLADANILNKLSPFFAILMSRVVLKEKPSKQDLITVFVAFTGALLVAKPTGNMSLLPAALGIFGGFGAGLAYTYVRKMGNHGERGTVIVAFFSVFSTLVTLPSLLFDYHPMTGRQLMCLICAGLAGMGGQFSITKAYTKAPAKEISVYDYTQVIFAALLGFVFFEQVPDAYSIAGYVIIIGAALFRTFRLSKDSLR